MPTEGDPPLEGQHLAWLARSFGRTDYLPLSAEDLGALEGAGDYVDKYPDTHLFREGDEANAAYVIQTSQVELYRGPKARRRIVGRVGEGAVIGDIAMFRGEPYISSARALGHVKAFRLERDRLIPVLLQRPTLAMRWLIAGLSQLERTQRRVLRLMHRTVKEQVAEMLLDEADRYGEVHLSQSSLATLLGASRQSVNEALPGPRAEGALETGYRRSAVLDSSRRRAVAEAGGGPGPARPGMRIRSDWTSSRPGAVRAPRPDRGPHRWRGRSDRAVRRRHAD